MRDTELIESPFLKQEKKPLRLVILVLRIHGKKTLDWTGKSKLLGADGLSSRFRT